MLRNATSLSLGASEKPIVLTKSVLIVKKIEFSKKEISVRGSLPEIKENKIG